MRYMSLISASPDCGPPPQKLMEEIAKLGEREMKAGRLVGQGGLAPLQMGAARVELRRGKLKVHDGPFTESKEVIGGFAIFELATFEEAVKAAEEFLELHRRYWPEFEGVCEVRPMFGEGEGCGAGAESAKAGAAA